MIDRRIEEAVQGRCSGKRRKAVDGLIIDDRWVWLVLGDEEVDTVGMLLGAAIDGVNGGTRICRRVEGDYVIIGEPDPHTDKLLSQLLDEDDADHV